MGSLRLGEEATIALCDTCDEHHKRDGGKGVECEGCGGFFCRGLCWNNHWCNVLTDRNGRSVKIDDVLIYPSTDRIYRITETPPTFIKSGIAYAAGRGISEAKRIIRPRLMELKE